MLKLKIKYSIEKHKNLGKDIKGDYVLWKESESESEHSYGAKGIFQGTKKQCEEYLKSLKKES